MAPDNPGKNAGDSKGPAVGLDRKIPFAEKLLFPATAGIGALLNSVIQLYLANYYNNIRHLDISYWGYMSVIPIAAAVLIPVFAVFIDRRTTHWGKYKPWVFIVLAGAGVGTFLVFLSVNLGPAGNFTYAMVTYAFVSIFLAAVQAVILGMTTAMTKRYDDRLQLAFSGSVWAAAGSLAVTYLALPLVSISGTENQGNRFLYLGLLCMIIAVALTLLLIRLGKERFVIPAPKQAAFSFGLLAKSLFKNKYALIAILFSFVLPLNTIRSSYYIYYSTGFFSDTTMMATLVMLTIAPSLVGILLSPLAFLKLSLKKTLLMALLVNVVASAAIFFVPATAFGAVAVYVLTGLGSLFLGLAGPAQRAMIPFAADYGEYQLHTNSAAFLGSVDSLAKQLGVALRNSAVVTGLFIPLAVKKPAGALPESALVGIRCSVSFLPALIFAILALIIFRWDLNAQKHKEIVGAVYSQGISDE